MRCKVYASDEGFGPLVRQSAVIEELRALEPGLDVVFQTHAQIENARWILQDVTLVDRYNNISWSKHPDGSPDLTATREALADYPARSEAFIQNELEDFDYDFVISDFVHEAFPVARARGAQSFGLTHFTWDWFFSKQFPRPVRGATLRQWHDNAELADVLYFPPFTPREILNNYARNSREIPLVVRKHKSSLPDGLDHDRFKVLVIDSGGQVLREQMQAAMRSAPALAGEFHFYVSSKLGLAAENVTPIDEKKFLVDHIPHVDLVIGRAGFNTISECIAFRTPMLLLGEARNPEMSENMMNLKHEGLGSFVSLDRFCNSLPTLLPRFVQYEYGDIRQAMRDHEIPTDGARVFAEEILERVQSGGGEHLAQVGS